MPISPYPNEHTNRKVVEARGIEPLTSCLQSKYSPVELRPRKDLLQDPVEHTPRTTRYPNSKREGEGEEEQVDSGAEDLARRVAGELLGVTDCDCLDGLHDGTIPPLSVSEHDGGGSHGPEHEAPGYGPCRVALGTEDEHLVPFCEVRGFLRL